jgi:hypothetical protein
MKKSYGIMLISSTFLASSSFASSSFFDSSAKTDGTDQDSVSISESPDLSPAVQYSKSAAHLPLMAHSTERMSQSFVPVSAAPPPSASAAHSESHKCTPEEDILSIKKVKEHGRKWKKIAKSVSG